MNKLYPIGIQSFEEIRKGGYHYVDKTRLIYQLVKTGLCYLLNRPRRFGKSLLVSTLESYFKGQKELFAGLAIDTLEQEWTEYPVLHLDLNAQKYETPDSLENILNDALSRWENYMVPPRLRLHFPCGSKALSSVQPNLPDTM